MPSPAWDDLSAFVDTDDFAVPVVIHFQAGGSRSVTGILDDPYQGAKLGEFRRDTANPMFTLKAPDATGVRRGDTLVCAGTTYGILTSPQPDGTGMMALDLAVE